MTPAGHCDCGFIVPVDMHGYIIGTAARDHFMVCPDVDANILEAQAGLDVSAIEAELEAQEALDALDLDA